MNGTITIGWSDPIHPKSRSAKNLAVYGGGRAASARLDGFPRSPITQQERPKIAPVPMSKVHFTSSGSEANDLAAKMVWYRSNALGKRDKKIIGRIKGYHGVTIAAGSITGLPRNHESFDLPLDQ